MITLKIPLENIKYNCIKIINISRKLFTPVATVCIIILLIKNHEILFNMYTKSEKLENIIISIFLISLSNFTSPLLTVKIFKHFNEKISYRRALYIHFSRLPARYLPGGVWQTVAKITDYKALGFSLNQLKKITIYEILTSFFSAVALALLLKVATSSISWALVAVMIAILLSKMSANPRDNTPRYNHWFTFIAAYTPVWLGYSTSFAFFFKAFDPETLSHTISLASSYLFSWAIGFLALFAPQGLGVSELAFSYMEKTNFGDISTTISVLFLFRMIVLTADLTCWTYSIFQKSEIN